jgi:hypothetical protein
MITSINTFVFLLNILTTEWKWDKLHLLTLATFFFTIIFLYYPLISVETKINCFILFFAFLRNSSTNVVKIHTNLCPL